MLVWNKRCQAGKCLSCNCSCEGKDGHYCESCNICTKNDNHVRNK